MRRAAIFLATAALLAAPAAVFAQEPFVAQLTGDAETPPVETDGSGSASFTISDDESSIDFEVTFDGLSGPATMAHIHFGPPDDAGPVMIWLTEVGVTEGSNTSPISGTATEAEFMAVDGGPQTFAEALQAIRDGDTYANVHTADNPGGEIRGQLRELPDTATAPASAPAVDSTALLLLALVGLSTFILAMRRFAFIRG